MLDRLIALACAAVMAAGCSTPADLDLSLDKASAAGTYRVALQPPAQAHLRLESATFQPLH